MSAPVDLACARCGRTLRAFGLSQLRCACGRRYRLTETTLPVAKGSEPIRRLDVTGAEGSAGAATVEPTSYREAPRVVRSVSTVWVAEGRTLAEVSQGRCSIGWVDAPRDLSAITLERFAGGVGVGASRPAGPDVLLWMVPSELDGRAFARDLATVLEVPCTEREGTRLATRHLLCDDCGSHAVMARTEFAGGRLECSQCSSGHTLVVPAVASIPVERRTTSDRRALEAFARHFAVGLLSIAIGWLFYDLPMRHRHGTIAPGGPVPAMFILAALRFFTAMRERQISGTFATTNVTTALVMACAATYPVLATLDLSPWIGVGIEVALASLWATGVAHAGGAHRPLTRRDASIRELRLEWRKPAINPNEAEGPTRTQHFALVADIGLDTFVLDTQLGLADAIAQLGAAGAQVQGGRLRFTSWHDATEFFWCGRVTSQAKALPAPTEP